jgi:hypothetical protein
VLLGESEQDLQLCLDMLNTWCAANKMTVNVNKSNIIHVRPTSVSRSVMVFKVGDYILHIVSEYRYLRLILTEHVDYYVMATHVAKSANRALGLVISKYNALGGLPFNTYTKLYDSTVWSTISYGAAICGDIICSRDCFKS